VKLRRAAVGALIVSLLVSGFSSWRMTQTNSVSIFLVTTAIIFVPIFALRVIMDVGGELLAGRHKTRQTVIDDRQPPPE